METFAIHSQGASRQLVSDPYFGQASGYLVGVALGPQEMFHQHILCKLRLSSIVNSISKLKK